MPDLLSISTWRSMFNKMGKGCGWIIAAVIGIPLAISFGLNPYMNATHGANQGHGNDDIVTVNGEPVSASQFNTLFTNMSRQSPPDPGQRYAEMVGATVAQLIRQKAIQEEAVRRNIHASQADIDKEIAKQRGEVLPKNASDADWDNFVETRLNMSPAEYRESLAKDLIGPAFQQEMESEAKVTPEDAKAQYNEVKLDVVLVPALSSSKAFASIPRHPAPLPDAEAKKKAEDLLAKVKTGADIAAIARADSADPTSKQGGVTGWKKEATELRLYGSDFTDAVKKTPKGELTPVVKSPGFNSGYVFAKVLDRRTNLPKDFDLKKAVEQLKYERASKDFSDLITTLADKAKVNFVDPDKKAYYDEFKAGEMEQTLMYHQFGMATGPAPTQAEVDKQKALADSEIAGVVKRHPDDATADLLYADILKQQKIAPDQRAKVNAQLIQLYQDALKSTENQSTRLELADLYRDSKQQDQAIKQYETIERLLDVSPPIGLDEMQQQLRTRQQLVVRFRSVGKDDEAKKEEAKIAALGPKITEAEAEQKASQALQNRTMPSIQLPGGGQKTITIPSPVSPGGAKPVTAPGAVKPGATPEAVPGAAKPGTPSAATPTAPAGKPGTPSSTPPGKPDNTGKTDSPDKSAAPPSNTTPKTGP